MVKRSHNIIVVLAPQCAPNCELMLFGRMDPYCMYCMATPGSVFLGLWGGFHTLPHLACAFFILKKKHVCKPKIMEFPRWALLYCNYRINHVNSFHSPHEDNSLVVSLWIFPFFLSFKTKKTALGIEEMLALESSIIGSNGTGTINVVFSLPTPTSLGHSEPWSTNQLSCLDSW